MLAELLRLASEAGLHSPAELADKLGTGRELVDLMLADLVRAGYLRPLEGCAATACSGCPHTETCSPDHPLAWVLTEKGARGLESGFFKRE
jgi:hypothetical protein